MSTITADQAVDQLTGEGYTRDDVVAAIDSLIESGLSIESDTDERVLTADEVQVVRDQLDS